VPAPPVSTAKSNGTEHILVVDDDALVRGVSMRLLGRAGYKVSTAVDGVEAIEWLKSADNKADLVLLDLAMPRLSGVDTMLEIRKLRPGLPIVLCSGSLTLTDPSSSRHVSGPQAPEARICKPYEAGELTGTVRQVLDVLAQAKAGKA
jgi:CheY-like chemotaxis protein